MGRFVNPGNSAFQVALDSEIYVDKTGLLEYTNKVLNTKQGYICNSRPRRFGKSICADMLAAYYSKGCDSERMFSNLQISNSPVFREHLNKYDVIHLDVQWCLDPAGGPERVVSYISEKTIEELREYYPSQLPEGITSLPDALSHINSSTGKKFIVIIDEWDVLIRDAAANIDVQEEYISFLRGMLKGVEPTRYIALAYLTGILPIKKEKTQSALNNFDEYTMISPMSMAPYFGFTEDEVKRLCMEYHRDFSEVKRWYDGYQLGEYHIYNPKAVVSVILWGEYRSYWTQTGTYESIQPYITLNYDGLKTAIIEMLSGASVPVEVRTFQNDLVNISDKDDILTLLIHLGYLAYNQNTRTAFIPNEEIRQEFELALRQNKWSELIAFQQASNALLEAALEEDSDTVSAGIEQIHNSYASVIQYHKEYSLSCVLTIAFLSTMEYYFMPIREMPTGRGFADFVYIPKPEYISSFPALVVELKWNQSAQTALQQIKEKRYTESLMHYSGEIILIGINYDKKTKQHTCSIERQQKQSLSGTSL